FFFSSRRRHTRSKRDWSSYVCSSDLTRPLYFSLTCPCSLLNFLYSLAISVLMRFLTCCFNLSLSLAAVTKFLITLRYNNIFGWFLFCFHYFFSQTKHGL